MQSLNTCPYWSIRTKASVSLLARSVTPTACIRSRTQIRQRPGICGLLTCAFILEYTLRSVRVITTVIGHANSLHIQHGCVVCAHWKCKFKSFKKHMKQTYANENVYRSFFIVLSI